MSAPVITVENLSKRYILGHKRSKDDGIRHVIEDALRTPLNWFRPSAEKDKQRETEEFWALKDVSFEIKQGEVLGIIGRNGAGKSTLLKILSRITEPTTGRIEIDGRVASLLEVGTGFHPELTGRENIYLNGAILGMGRGEIRRKFDEIVAFSEVEKFLDTPVKRYSSGMYVRLAFAVAAHLEPEILIVDEVLAVGDAQFQQKCLGKMQDISSGGRTVLFVSHSMPAVLRLCTSAVLLSSGTVVTQGETSEVTRQYMSRGTTNPAERIWPTQDRAPGDAFGKIKAVRAVDAKGAVCNTFKTTDAVSVEVEYWQYDPSKRFVISLHFIDEEGTVLFASNDWNDGDWWMRPRTKGVAKAICRIPSNFLAEGQISVLAALCTYNPNVVHALERDAISFQVAEDAEATTARGEYTGNWPGVIRPHLNWTAGYVETSR